MLKPNQNSLQRGAGHSLECLFLVHCKNWTTSHSGLVSNPTFTPLAHWGLDRAIPKCIVGPSVPSAPSLAVRSWHFFNFSGCVGSVSQSDRGCVWLLRQIPLPHPSEAPSVVRWRMDAVGKLRHVQACSWVIVYCLMFSPCKIQPVLHGSRGDPRHPPLQHIPHSTSPNRS